MKCIGSIFVSLACFLSIPVTAGSISVVPVLLESEAPALATAITLSNGASREAVVQVRVFRWQQVDGVESLQPTTDVVVSPPSMKMEPGGEYTVRIVRTAKRPVQGTEGYRVIVDELPRLASDSNTVNLLVRQSIPVFFSERLSSLAQVAWSLATRGRDLVLTASNRGDGYLRIADLKLEDQAGRRLSFGNGLIGYVLARSEMSWVLPDAGSMLQGNVALSAVGQKGPISAEISAPR